MKSHSALNVRGDFHIDIAMQSVILTIFSKTHQKYQNDVLCGNMTINIFLYILKFKLFFKSICSIMTAWLHVCSLLSPSVMTCLPKKVSVITIYRNKTHLINIAYFIKQKHQQQRYNNENTEICMLIYHM